LAAGNISKADAAALTGLLGAMLVLSSSLALFGPRWPRPRLGGNDGFRR
jgi:hypothetical protein